MIQESGHINLSEADTNRDVGATAVQKQQPRSTVAWQPRSDEMSTILVGQDCAHTHTAAVLVALALNFWRWPRFVVSAVLAHKSLRQPKGIANNTLASPQCSGT
jgi:hypothetical protein